MALPKMTAEQQQVALAAAKSSRARQKDVKEQVKAGKLTFAQVLELAKEERPVARIKVLQALTAINGIGKAGALKLMSECSIDENKRIGALGTKQAAKLVASLG